MITGKSKTLFKQASEMIPGGVNSPVRAFGSVGTDPVYITKGSGSLITDVDGNAYVDFCGSWGPLALGHAHPLVINAIRETAGNGLSFGTCCPLEVEFAELFLELVPHADMVRTVSSGTEAVMTALRLARGFTGRDKILKFDGCYHGHSDCLLTAAGSGLLTNALSFSKGVTQKTISEVISAPYNDLNHVKEIFAKEGKEIAAIIIEPVAGNMGLVMPEPGFLEALREICDEYGACLIFDEVITGFRFHAGAYATKTGITPDISTFGKIIGGGMPIGAVAGKKEIMEHLAPLGEVYQAGTLSGNPVALAAGITTLKTLRDTNPYPDMAKLASVFADTVNAAATDAYCAVSGGVFTLFFTANQPKCLSEVKACDTERFAAYFRHMLAHGFYVSPSQFELNFISAAHTEPEVKAAAEVAVAFLNM